MAQAEYYIVGYPGQEKPNDLIRRLLAKYMRCPKCETRNSVAASKCKECGERLKSKSVKFSLGSNRAAIESLDEQAVSPIETPQDHLFNVEERSVESRPAPVASPDAVSAPVSSPIPVEPVSIGLPRRPLPIKKYAAAAGVVAGVVVLGLAAMAVVPSMFDSEQHLQKLAKRVAKGPKDFQEAMRMKGELEAGFQDFLNKNKKLSAKELQEKLQKILPSSAYEVHIFDLPNSSKLVELDTLLQSSSFIVSQKRAALLKGFDVYDAARTVEAGPDESKDQNYMVLLGHQNAQSGRKPQIKVLSLKGDDFNDISSNAVPSFTGDGSATFAKTGADISMELSIASKATTEKLFAISGITASGLPDETVKASMTFNQGKYTLQEASGKDKLACLRAVAFVLADPTQKDRFYKYFPAVAGRLVGAKPLSKRNQPLFYISANGSGAVAKEIVKQSDDGDDDKRGRHRKNRRRRHRQVEKITVNQTTNKFKIYNDDDAFALSLARDNGMYVCVDFKRVATTPEGSGKQGAIAQGYENQTSSLVDRFLDAPNAPDSAISTGGPVEISSPSKIVERRAASQSGTITSNLSSPTVKLRAGAGTGNRIVGEIPKGSPLEIIGKQDGWYKIRSNNKEGYVYGGFVLCTTADAYTTATARRDASIRDENNNRIGHADAGDRFVMIGSAERNKYKVQLSSGRFGYIERSALDVGGDGTVPEAPASAAPVVRPSRPGREVKKPEVKSEAKPQFMP